MEQNYEKKTAYIPLQIYSKLKLLCLVDESEGELANFSLPRKTGEARNGSSLLSLPMQLLRYSASDT